MIVSDGPLAQLTQSALLAPGCPQPHDYDAPEPSLDCRLSTAALSIHHVQQETLNITSMFKGTSGQAPLLIPNVIIHFYPFSAEGPGFRIPRTRLLASV